MIYATMAQQTNARAKLGSRPFSINDADGNILEGNVIPEGLSPAGFDLTSERQRIPDGTTPAQIAAHVKAGNLRKAIFAKSLDVRLPVDIVDMINEKVDRQDRFSFAILTSRPEDEILKILDQSGVRQSGMVTMVADSGAILRLGGQRTVVRALTGEEKRVFDQVQREAAHLDRIAGREAASLGFDGNLPALLVREKAIGVNFDYRPVLDRFGQGDGSPLDHAIGAALKRHLRKVADSGPLDAETGKLALGTLDGPANVELKVASVNKKVGLAALLEAAMASPNPPTGFAFSGDDLAKKMNGVGEPGTDYYAAAAVPELSRRFGIPGIVIHTHHPIGNDLDSRIPDPDKSPATLASHYARVVPDLVFPTPMATGRFVLGLLGRDAFDRKAIPAATPRASRSQPL